MMEHGFHEISVAHSRKYDVRINAGHPPYNERVWLISIYVAAEENNAA